MYVGQEDFGLVTLGEQRVPGWHSLFAPSSRMAVAAPWSRSQSPPRHALSWETAARNHRSGMRGSLSIKN